MVHWVGRVEELVCILGVVLGGDQEQDGEPGGDVEEEDQV